MCCSHCVVSAAQPSSTPSSSSSTTLSSLSSSSSSSARCSSCKRTGSPLRSGGQPLRRFFLTKEERLANPATAFIPFDSTCSSYRGEWDYECECGRFACESNSECRQGWTNLNGDVAVCNECDGKVDTACLSISTSLPSSSSSSKYHSLISSSSNTLTHKHTDTHHVYCMSTSC